MTWQPRTWFTVALIGLLASVGLMGVGLTTRWLQQEPNATQCYTPLTGNAEWYGDWELSDRGADPSQSGSLEGADRVTIEFAGSELALRVRRGGYRAYLWVTVDGEPANQLPRTGRGAYLVLSSPDHEPQMATISVASGLSDGLHTAEVVADRGWNQWPLAGWCVTQETRATNFDEALRGLAGVAVICLIGALASAAAWARALRRPAFRHRPRFPCPARHVSFLPSILGFPVAVATTAALFYFSSWLPLTVVSGFVLAVTILLRLDLGLALAALVAPFYLHPRPLLGRSFSLVEITVLLCLVSWGVSQARKSARRSTLTSLAELSSVDLGVLFLVLAAGVSTLFAEVTHVALRELRVVILGPALFYLMLRTVHATERAVWRIVDAFVAGAVAVALIGLVQYAFGVNVITAEQGFRRLRSVFGSPNNAALYLGRALPVLVAITLFSVNRRRRLAYGLAALPVASAFLLTFSRAAILLGVPASLLVLGLLARGRWRWIAPLLLIVTAVVVVPLLSTPRFQGLLDPGSGTLFFRLQLWRSSWNMFRDHPWVGVGPDNFLYQYRGRYILPSAWEEPHLSHAHNFLLSHATRLGLIGLAAAVWLQVSFWRTALGSTLGLCRDRKALALGLAASMAYALGHGLVDASFFFVDLAFAFLLALALVQWAVAGEAHREGS